MTFQEFKAKYQQVPVETYPNEVPVATAQLIVKLVTYNQESYIRQCLDSVLMQKVNFDFYILLAEDDSSDNTRKICIEYAKKYPSKIKLLLTMYYS